MKSSAGPTADDRVLPYTSPVVGYRAVPGRGVRDSVPLSSAHRTVVGLAVAPGNDLHGPRLGVPRWRLFLRPGSVRATMACPRPRLLVGHPLRHAPRYRDRPGMGQVHPPQPRLLDLDGPLLHHPAPRPRALAGEPAVRRHCERRPGHSRRAWSRHSHRRTRADPGGRHVHLTLDIRAPVAVDNHPAVLPDPLGRVQPGRRRGRDLVRPPLVDAGHATAPTHSLPSSVPRRSSETPRSVG